MRELVVSLFVLTFLSSSHAWLSNEIDSNSDNAIRNESSKSSYDYPLIITPYLKKGSLIEAKKASRVGPLLKGTGFSYSGFFTVDERYESNMFFWYFPAENSPESAPVVLWLQGGPGVSSLDGLFYENGIYVDEEGKLGKRDIYWSKTMHVIYIDNPVEVGFSFIRNKTGLSKDEVSIGKNLYESLQQFFTMFPELRDNDFFITGESYAGKYIPALGYTIHRNNLSAKNKIRLKGLAIGSGWVDPINQVDYSSLLLEIGLIDENQKASLDELQDKIRNKINNKDWEGAYDDYETLFTLVYNITGSENVYNYLKNDGDSHIRLTNLLSLPQIRKNIHAGNQEYKYFSNEVESALIPDMFKSVAPWLSTLTDNYRVLAYNGQLDIVVGYPSTANYLNKLIWCGRDQFLSAERKYWREKGNVAGYIKTSAPANCNGSLSLALIRSAGHSVPSDQPLIAYHLIHNFTHNILI